MKIEHIAIWAIDLENMRRFYENFFGATANDLYVNPKKQFSSYFLSFDSGARLELMHHPDLAKRQVGGDGLQAGFIHFAMSVGTKEEVDRLTGQLREGGFTIKGEPRWTGDGYYESVVLDPEGNQIEITI